MRQLCDVFRHALLTAHAQWTPTQCSNVVKPRHGLGAKPQFSVAKYHDVCREVLGDTLLPPHLQVG